MRCKIRHNFPINKTFARFFTEKVDLTKQFKEKPCSTQLITHRYGNNNLQGRRHTALCTSSLFPKHGRACTLFSNGAGVYLELLFTAENPRFSYRRE